MDKKIENWEIEWAIIQEREYDNCLTKGLSDKQAQRIINEHDTWIHNLLNSSRQELLESLKEKLMKTKDSNSAFMTMRNGKGEIVDWTLTVSEFLGLLDEELNQML